MKKAFWAILWISFISSPAQAHLLKLSDSELILQGEQTTWTLRIHLGDFEQFFGQAGKEVLQSFLPRRLEISVGGTPCHFRDLDLQRDLEQQLATLRLFYLCPVRGSPVQINYNLFFGDENHRHLMKLRMGSKTLSYTFSPDHTEVQFSRKGISDTILSFLKLGMEHIFFGYDHILFIMTLILGASRFKNLLWLVTSFTLAHSISLALAGLDIITLSPNIVEPLIAASIVLVAILDLLDKRKFSLVWMSVLTFVFGLIHGLGFSFVLREAQLTRSELVIPLVCFNLGVELGQLLIISLVYPLTFALARWIKGFYPFLKRGALLLIAGTGVFWMVQRIWGGNG